MHNYKICMETNPFDSRYDLKIIYANRDTRQYEHDYFGPSDMDELTNKAREIARCMHSYGISFVNGRGDNRQDALLNLTNEVFELYNDRYHCERLANVAQIMDKIREKALELKMAHVMQSKTDEDISGKINEIEADLLHIMMAGMLIFQAGNEDGETLDE